MSKPSIISLQKLPNKSSNLSIGLGHNLLQAIDLEESVLGALLLEKDALTDVIDILKPANFYKQAHQDIYQAITMLFNSTAPVDIRTVVNQLRKNGKLDQVGGPAYLASLTDSVASAAHIETHARIIVECAMRRALARLASQIKIDTHDNAIETFPLIDKFQQALFEISEDNIRKNYTHVGTLMNIAFKELEAKKNHKDGVIGIPTGFTALDRLILGWQKSDFVVIAARPGMGKTSFMLSMLCNAAIKNERPVAFFSLEMSALQITNRLIAAEAGLENEKIKKGKLEYYEWEQLFHKTSKLSQAPIYIDDTPGLSLFEFRAKCRRLKARHNIQMVAIDYLQLMSGDSYRRGGGNREQEIASISRGIKAISKELDIPIIAASQLSRAVETRGGDKRPQLSDLRESGAIEQDVDIAMFLYRPEYYGITEDDTGNPTQGLAEVIVAKHRNGPLGKIPLKYIATLTKFVDFSTNENFDTFADETPFDTLKKESKANMLDVT